MREIENIIVHCADTPPDMDIGAEEIRKWHTDPEPRGNGWSRMGYHYVIRRNGTIETGEPEEVIAYHTKGYNTNSIGICLVGGALGKFDYTYRQIASLRSLVDELLQRFPTAKVRGHCDFASHKSCPNFDAQRLLQDSFEM